MEPAGFVALYRDRDPISRMVQLQTRSVYNHAALVFDPVALRLDDVLGSRLLVLEAVPPKVRRRTFDPGYNISDARAHLFSVEGMTPEQWRIALDFATSELGEPYDWQSVIRFVTRSKASRDERWFCSEYVYAALERGGHRLLERHPAWANAPGHLAWATKLNRYILPPF